MMMMAVNANKLELQPGPLTSPTQRRPYTVTESRLVARDLRGGVSDSLVGVQQRGEVTLSRVSP